MFVGGVYVEYKSEHTDVCVLTLYFDTLLEVFISDRDFSGSLQMRILFSAPCPCLFVFISISFSCLIALAET